MPGKLTQVVFLCAALLVFGGCPAKSDEPIAQVQPGETLGEQVPFQYTPARVDYGILDCHEHIQGLKQAPKTVAAMDRIGIEKVVLVGSSWFTITMNEKHGFTKYEWVNDQLLKVMNKYPGRFEAWPTIDPEKPDDLDAFKELVRRGATGLKLYLGHSFVGKDGRYFFHKMALDDPRMMPVYEYCQENYIPICYHVNPGPNAPGYAEELIAVMDEFPDLKLNVPHFMLSSIKHTRLMAFLDAYPNLWTDTSFGFEDYQIDGLIRFSRSREKYRKLFEKYSDRIMFATDNVITSASFKSEDWLYDHVQCYVDMLALEEYTTPFVTNASMTKYLGKIKRTKDVTDQMKANPKEPAVLKGLALSDEILKKVLRTNYEEFTSRKPKDTVTFKVDWSKTGLKRTKREPGQQLPPRADRVQEALAKSMKGKMKKILPGIPKKKPANVSIKQEAQGTTEISVKTKEPTDVKVTIPDPNSDVSVEVKTPDDADKVTTPASSEHELREQDDVIAFELDDEGCCPRDA